MSADREPTASNRFVGCESIEEIVYQAVGAGSVCWHPDGVFDDVSAGAVAQDALDEIRRRAFLDSDRPLRERAR